MFITFVCYIYLINNETKYKSSRLNNFASNINSNTKINFYFKIILKIEHEK